MGLLPAASSSPCTTIDVPGNLDTSQFLVLACVVSLTPDYKSSNSIDAREDVASSNKKEEYGMEQQKVGLYRFGRVVTSLTLVGVMFAVASTASTGTVGAKSKYGGTIAVAVNSPPDCLDPQETAAASADQVDGYVFDSLLSIDTHAHFVGDLATSYKVSNHGTIITFKLRHGVRFSNGDPFTAAAVKYTFDRAVNPATKSPVSGPDLADVASTKAVSKYVVRLNLKAANRPLLTNLAGAYTGIMDPKATKKQGNNTCNAPVGTGPYKIKSTGASFSDIKLVANKYNNFGPSWVHNRGKPYVTNTEIETIPSADTEVSDLLTGSLTMVAIEGSQLPRVRGDKKIVIHKLPADDLDWISFNNAHKPFNIPAVRRAVAATIDRKGIVKGALNGQGKAVYGPLPPAVPDYDKAAGKYMPKFNINAAAKVFKKYHMLGKTYQLLTCTSCGALGPISEILQADMARAGLNVKIESASGVGDFESKAVAGDYDMDLLAYTYPDPSVLAFLLAPPAKGGALNWLNYSNKTLNTLLAKQQTTLAPKRVTKLFDQIQTLVNKQAIFVGLDSESVLLGVRSNVKGFHTNSQGAWAIQDLYFG